LFFCHHNIEVLIVATATSVALMGAHVSILSNASVFIIFNTPSRIKHADWPAPSRKLLSFHKKSAALVRRHITGTASSDANIVITACAQHAY
jgi:hypothetical protein